MLQLLKIHRLNSLKEQYKMVKADAKKFMRTGDLKNYLHKLSEATKIQREYQETLTLEV